MLIIESGVGFANRFQPGPTGHPEQAVRDRHFLLEAHGPETIDLDGMQRLKVHDIHFCQLARRRKSKSIHEGVRFRMVRVVR